MSVHATAHDRHRALGKALVWLIVAAVVDVLFFGLWTTYRLMSDRPSGDIVVQLIRLLGSVGPVCLLGAFASWVESDGRLAARTGLWIRVTGYALSLLVTHLGYPLTRDDASARDTLQLLQSGLGVVMTFATFLVYAAMARRARSALAWSLFAGLALARIGRLLVGFEVFDLTRDDLDVVVPVLNMTYTTLALALAVTLLVRHRRATPDEAPIPAEESWAVAMRGARIVRQAEIARVTLVVGFIVVGLLAAAGRSMGLLIASVAIAALGALGVTVATLVGYARMRRIPFASDARGTAHAAFVLSLLALAGGLVAMAQAVLPMLLNDPDLFGPGALDEVALSMASIGVAASLAFLASLRRAGRKLDDPDVASRATTAIVTYALGLPLLAVTRTSFFGEAPRGVALALIGLALILLVVGLVAFLGSLRHLVVALARRDLLARAEPFA